MLFIITFIDGALGAPPFITTTSSDGLEISSPGFDVLTAGQDFDFPIHVFNFSNGVYITSATCYMHLYNHSGKHLLALSDSSVAHDFDFEFPVKGGNLTAGSYFVNFQCNTSATGGGVRYDFEVTPTGTLPTTSQAFFYIGLMGVLIFLLILMFWAHMQDQTELARFWWFAFMWIPLWALLFIGWNMARDLLAYGGAIQSVLYLAWLIIAIVYPFFLLGLVLYTFYYIYKQKEVQRLIERGFSLEDAQNRSGGRGRGMNKW
jgi:hypothetical protein